MLQRNFGFNLMRQNFNILRLSGFSLSYHVWAAELKTMHAHRKSHKCIVAAVPNYGEHAFDYVIILWRHNLGAIFLYIMFAIKEMFNERWRLCHFQYSERPRVAGFRSVNPAERLRENLATPRVRDSPIWIQPLGVFRNNPTPGS